MAGLLSDAWDDPQTQGLLTLGLGLLGSRGSFAQGLSQAGQKAMGAYTVAQRNQAGLKSEAMQQQLMQARLQQEQMQQAEMQRQAEQQLKIQGAIARNRVSPAQQVLGVNGGAGPTPAAAAALPNTPAGFNWQGFAGDLAGIDPMKAIGLQQSLRKEAPELKDVQVMRDPASGQMVNVMIFKDGTTKVAPYGARPDIALQGLGDRMVAVDKNAAQNGQSWQMGASPDARLQANTTMRGQNLTDARSRESTAASREATAAAGNYEYKQDAQGNWMALPKRLSGPGASIQPIPVASVNKQTNSARNALSIIDQAEPLIDRATSSFIGQGVDLGARVFGHATPGAEAAAQLKALEGALMMQQPRMEGPQSDKDVAMYRQMAGQIGDPSVPAASKKAALGVIRQLHERYAAGSGGGAPAAPWAPAPSAGGGFKILGVE